MATSPRIPRSIDPFHNYINSTSDHLEAGEPETNATRLGFSKEETDGWTAIKVKWNPLYEKYKDKETSRTTSIKNKLLLLIGDTITYDKDYNFLDRISVSLNVTVDDLSIFNIKKGLLEKTTRTVPSTSIRETVEPILQPFGGGNISLKCYSSTSARPAIFGDADSVQYLYVVGTTPPESVNDPNLTLGLSTRAIFDLALGAENGGKRIYIFLRWYNTKHPELAGPWSDMQTSFLL
jgi:hypothetical protein